MKLWSFLLCSQDQATNPYPGPDQSSPRPRPISEDLFNVTLPSAPSIAFRNVVVSDYPEFGTSRASPKLDVQALSDVFDVFAFSVYS